MYVRLNMVILFFDSINIDGKRVDQKWYRNNIFMIIFMTIHFLYKENQKKKKLILFEINKFFFKCLLKSINYPKIV